jgi:hypothetical protein
MIVYNRHYDEREYAITLVEKDSMYTAYLSRLNQPFFTIEYDHVTKTGRPLLEEGEKPPGNMKALIEKAIRFGKANLSFSDLEIELFKSNLYIKSQYKVFKQSLPLIESKQWQFKRFLNYQPFKLSIDD